MPPTPTPTRPHPPRKSHKELRRTSWIHDGDVEWHGVTPNTPDWSDTSRFLAYSLKKPGGGGLYIAFNAGHLPQVGGSGAGVEGGGRQQGGCPSQALFSSG